MLQRQTISILYLNCFTLSSADMASQPGTDEERASQEHTPDLSGGQSDNGQSQATTSSASKGERKRAKQFIAAENEVLVDGVIEHYNQLFNRPYVYSTECKDAIWRKIADDVSAVGVTLRTAEVCRKRYNDCKSSVRKKMSLCNRNASDGGPSTVIDFLPWENKIKEQLDSEAISVFAFGLDTGSKSSMSRFGHKPLQPNKRFKYSATTGKPVHNRSCQTTHRRHHHFSSKYRKTSHRTSTASLSEPKMGAQTSASHIESTTVTSNLDNVPTTAETTFMKQDEESSNVFSQSSEANPNSLANTGSLSGTGEDCTPSEQTPELSGGQSDNGQSQATTSSVSKGDRKRAKQFIAAENEVLVDGVSQYYNQLFGRPNNCTTDFKDAIWRKIADDVSAVGVTHRTAEVCRKRFNDCKCSVRRKLSQCNQDTSGTEGAPSTILEFLPWEIKIKDYLETEVISSFALGLDTGSTSTITRFGPVSFNPVKSSMNSLATGRLDDVRTDVESTWIKQSEETSNFVSQSTEDNVQATFDTTWIKEAADASNVVSKSSEDNVQAVVETTWIKQDDEASNFVSLSSVENVEVKQESINTEDEPTEVTLDQYPQKSQNNNTNIPPHVHSDTTEKWKTHTSPTLPSVDNAAMDLGLDIRACTEDHRSTASELDDVFSKTLNVFSNVIREEVGGVRSELTEVREILTDMASSHTRIANSFETITEILKDYMRTNHELLSTQKEILTALRTLEQTPMTFPTPESDMDGSSIITTSNSRFGSPSNTSVKRSRSQRNIKRTRRFLEQ